MLHRNSPFRESHIKDTDGGTHRYVSVKAFYSLRNQYGSQGWNRTPDLPAAPQVEFIHSLTHSCSLSRSSERPLHTGCLDAPLGKTCLVGVGKAAGHLTMRTLSQHGLGPCCSLAGPPGSRAGPMLCSPSPLSRPRDLQAEPHRIACGLLRTESHSPLLTSGLILCHELRPEIF